MYYAVWMVLQQPINLSLASSFKKQNHSYIYIIIYKDNNNTTMDIMGILSLVFQISDLLARGNHQENFWFHLWNRLVSDLFSHDNNIYYTRRVYNFFSTNGTNYIRCVQVVIQSYLCILGRHIILLVLDQTLIDLYNSYILSGKSWETIIRRYIKSTKSV